MKIMTEYKHNPVRLAYVSKLFKDQRLLMNITYTLYEGFLNSRSAYVIQVTSGSNKDDKTVQKNVYK